MANFRVRAKKMQNEPGVSSFGGKTTEAQRGSGSCPSHTSNKIAIELYVDGTTPKKRKTLTSRMVLHSTVFMFYLLLKETQSGNQR